MEFFSLMKTTTILQSLIGISKGILQYFIWIQPKEDSMDNPALRLDESILYLCILGKKVAQRLEKRDT